MRLANIWTVGPLRLSGIFFLTAQRVIYHKTCQIAELLLKEVHQD